MFTVLRTASDEVNLHSRFLHALLDHTDQRSGDRKNLKAFLDKVVEARDFDARHARVEREANHIDLLIRNAQQAVVIENKIWAGDQCRQLQRYRDDLVLSGYADAAISLVYLTPDGHEPAAQSRGEIPVGRVKLVAYADKDKMQDWLIGCQRRAFDEPRLRESIAQYLHLIRRMTNTDDGGEHMSDLKDLLLERDNLVLASQLSGALAPAKVALVQRFYSYVDQTLREKIEGLGEVDPDWRHLNEEEAIRKSISGARLSDSGLYYRIADGTWLFVAGEDRLSLGVNCEKDEYPDLHDGLKQALAGVDAPHGTSDWAPWWKHVDEMPSWSHPGEWLHFRSASNEPSLRFLSGGKKDQANLVTDVASTLGRLLAKIKEHELAE